jgi:hypothetical protein
MSLRCPWSLSWRHAVPTEAVFRLHEEPSWAPSDAAWQLERWRMKTHMVFAVMLSAWVLWHDVSVHHGGASRLAGPTYEVAT